MNMCLRLNECMICLGVVVSYLQWSEDGITPLRGEELGAKLWASGGAAITSKC